MLMHVCTCDSTPCQPRPRPQACAGNVTFAPALARRTSLAELNRGLGDEWAAKGAAEHASVASFARHTLQLLALGAPPTFLEQAQQASIDEIKHAKLCYSTATAYYGYAVGPGKLHAGLTFAPFHVACSEFI